LSFTHFVVELSVLKKCLFCFTNIYNFQKKTKLVSTQKQLSKRAHPFENKQLFIQTSSRVILKIFPKTKQLKPENQIKKGKTVKK